MNTKYLYLIPLTLLEVILQLAFFWLAPEVPCYWVVYVFGTVMTLIHMGVTFVLGTKYGVRRGAATIVAGSVCQVILVATCGVLLASGANIRNAVFALLIVSMLYAIIVTLLVLSIEKEDMLDAHTINPFEDGDDASQERLNNDMVREPSMTPPVYKPHIPRDGLILVGVPRGPVTVNNGATPPPLPTRR